jgi:hypothetical protein
MITTMPFDEYLSLDRISKHGLDAISRSPAHFAYSKAHPTEPTPAMMLGTAVHAMVLENESFFDRFAISPAGIDRRTKAGKADWAAFLSDAQGKRVITPDDFDLVRGMADAVHAHPAASKLLSSGIAEQTVLWDDPETGVHCKARPDFLYDKAPIAVDLKTAKSAAQGQFYWDARKYRYHVQDAMYSAGLAVAGHPVDHFVFIVVESIPPHGVAAYVLAPEDRDHGWTLFRQGIEVYAKCKREGVWPGYPDDIQVLERP